MITGVILIYLREVYDTINHNLLLEKQQKLTKDHKLVKVVETLCNRWFFVVLDFKKRKYRTQKNGLPQGSVLTLMLYNVYTNDQPRLGYTTNTTGCKILYLRK